MKTFLKFVFISLFTLSIGSFAQAETVVTDTVDNPGDQIECATLTHNLILGSRDAMTGGDVSTLQIYLLQANYLDSDPTGFFGKLTKKAVQDFQKANSISPIGNVGPITRAKIKELSCKENTTTASNQAESYITILSPNERGYISLGKTIPVKWKSSQPNVGSVSIYLKNEETGKEITLEDNTPNNGFYEAKTDSISVPGIVPGAYRVSICLDKKTTSAHSCDVKDSSDNYFKIVEDVANQTTSSFLTFTSPQSGDVVSLETPTQVKWRFDDLTIEQNYNSSYAYVILKIISSSGQVVGSIGDGYLLSTTTALWDIKQYKNQGFYSLVSGEKYKIRATLVYQPKFTCDPSNEAGRTDCVPLYSSADKVLITKAKQYQSESGWFVVGQNSSTESLGISQVGSTVTITGPSSLLSKIEGCRYTGGFNGASGNGLTVNWGDGKYEPSNSLSLTTTTIGSSCSSVVRTHTYGASGKYTIVVTSWHPGPADAPITDWSGSQTVSITNGAVVDQTVPSQGPSVPQNLSSSNVTQNSVTISWSPSLVIGNTVLTGYKVYRGGTLVATLGNVTTYTDTNLSAGNNYSYTVQAFDTAGNISPQSSALLVATQEIGLLPTVPTSANSVSFSSIGSTSPGSPITVSWRMTGTKYPKDWIGIVPKGTSWKGASLQQIWFYTNGAESGSQKIYLPIATGDYDAVYYRNDSVADEVMRSSTPITVGGATPYDFVLSTAHTKIKAGDGIIVYWKANAATAGVNDWLALVPTGTSWKSGLPWVYTNGASSGGVTLPTTLSLPSGAYDILYYTSGQVKKSSNPITIEVSVNPVAMQQNGYGYGVYNQTASLGSLFK